VGLYPARFAACVVLKSTRHFRQNRSLLSDRLPVCTVLHPDYVPEHYFQTILLALEPGVAALSASCVGIGVGGTPVQERGEAVRRQDGAAAEAVVVTGEFGSDAPLVRAVNCLIPRPRYAVPQPPVRPVFFPRGQSRPVSKRHHAACPCFRLPRDG